MVQRLVVLVRASQQARGERPELEKDLFHIARHRPMTGQAGHQGEQLRAVRRLKVGHIARRLATRGRKVGRIVRPATRDRKVGHIVRPGLEARGVRVAARRGGVVHLGRSMGDHKMVMDAPVAVQVIAVLHPVDQLVGRVAQRLR